MYVLYCFGNSYVAIQVYVIFNITHGLVLFICVGHSFEK